jgi:hypothetical protein
MSATLDLATGYIYLAYVNDNEVLTDNNDDIRTAVYDGSAWTSMANVLTNVSGRGILDVAIAIDQNNSDVYVAYTIQDTAGTLSSANIYYSKNSTSVWTLVNSTIYASSTSTTFNVTGVDYNDIIRIRVKASSWSAGAASIINASISGGSVTSGTPTKNVVVATPSSIQAYHTY